MKLKLNKQDEFVVVRLDRARRHAPAFRIADPRRARRNGRLRYAGDVGTGFNGAELDRIMKLLKRLETPTCPFDSEAENAVGEGNAALGEAAARRAGSLHRDHRRRAAAPSGVSGAPGRQARRRRSRCQEVPRVPEVPKATSGTASSKVRETVSQRVTSTRSIDQLELPREGAQERAAEAARRRHARGHQPSQDLLAGGQEDQGRSDSLLRADRAAHPAGDRQPAAGDEAVAERRRRPVVLSASRAGAGAAGRAHRDAARRRRAGAVDRRLAEDAALHGAAGVDLDGPVVLDDGRPATRPIRSRSISIRSRARRSRRSSTSRAGCDEELDRVQGARAFRRRPAPKGCTSSSRCRRARRTKPGMLFCQIVATMVATKHPKVATVERMVQAPQGRHGLRRLPAEHPGQDAGLRLQRARQRVRRRVDAADVGGSARPAEAAGLHDRHDRAAREEGRRPVGGACGSTRAPTCSPRSKSCRRSQSPAYVSTARAANRLQNWNAQLADHLALEDVAEHVRLDVLVEQVDHLDRGRDAGRRRSARRTRR